MAIDKEVLDQLLAGRAPEELFGKDGLLDELKKALSERMLAAELDDHLENESAQGAVNGAVNRRNGSSSKTVLTETSKLTLAIPRDRAGTFDPKLIAKYQRRLPGFDDKIASMIASMVDVRARDDGARDPRAPRGALRHRRVAGSDLDDHRRGHGDGRRVAGRLLDACYPLVFFDAIRVKIRDEGFVRNKAVYIALGILPDGTKEVLGIWIEQTEGAKHVLSLSKGSGCGS